MKSHNPDTEDVDMKSFVLESGIYKGHFNEKLKVPEGRGTLVTHDGALYEGDFVNGKFHGLGQWVHEDGSMFKGQFVKGLANGKGKYKGTKGERYEGDWV